jgi:hypothetical protein
MFFVQEGFTYRNFLMDALAIFFFVVWFWLLIVVFADLFRRHDISGWIKAIWVTPLPGRPRASNRPSGVRRYSPNWCAAPV